LLQCKVQQLTARDVVQPQSMDFALKELKKKLTCSVRIQVLQFWNQMGFFLKKRIIQGAWLEIVTLFLM